MREFIGRSAEYKQFDNFMVSDKAEFLVVYGRRRVGKTFLIKSFFQNKFSFYISGAENASKEEQLHNFAVAMEKYSNVPYPKVENWTDAFVQLTHYLENVKTNGRIVVFFDELPWLDNQKSGFLSAFEYFWNTYASTNDKNFFVFCCSATSWITNNILKNRGGLHNRVTRQIHLQPFTLAETEQFFKSKKIVMSRYQIVECYMIFGGIPYYLEQLDKSLGLVQNVDKLLFSHDGALRNEFKEVYYSLFKKPEKYMKIIEVLSKKRKGITREDIIKQSKIADGGSLTRILDELELCGFIAINRNFVTSKRNNLYQLVDFFSLFYLNFVKNQKGFDTNYWSSLTNNAEYRAWSGYSFELVCQAHITQIKKALSIGGVVSYIAGWRSRCSANNACTNGAQIDLLIDRNDNIINIFEIKFSDKKFVITKKYDEVLRNKRGAFIEETGTKKAVHLTMLTTYGVERNEYWGNIQSEITMNDLFIS
ncbi:MAG: ATP-binding protein [Prevotellaceae bacterium]|jgi:AAA+ ATPase superfamily predicted ATPase|nr:ATP-binding protein [Prevotellaceae bacterium]